MNDAWTFWIHCGLPRAASMVIGATSIWMLNTLTTGSSHWDTCRCSSSAYFTPRLKPATKWRQDVQDLQDEFCRDRSVRCCLFDLTQQPPNPVHPVHLVEKSVFDLMIRIVANMIHPDR